MESVDFYWNSVIIAENLSMTMFILCFCVSRRRTLQRKAQEAQVSAEEQEEMLRNLERRETEFMRLQRRKVGIDDFEQLTVIGKGAFGEVYEKMLFAET